MCAAIDAKPKRKRNRVYPRGEDHPRWSGGERQKTCRHCGKEFGLRPKQPITTFRKQKFCSKPCADAGGKRYCGAQNHKWRADRNVRRLSRGSKQNSWARAVIGRDQATCQGCGARGVELHAHHIKEWRKHPELRWELSNGVTLCAACHWLAHSALDENGVNSGKLPPGNAEDNPEPSFGRKPVEGVTTRGRAYRRWNGHCGWCNVFISKRWSDTIGKAALFCSKSCASKWRVANGKAFNANGSNASTSAPPEREDIV